MAEVFAGFVVGYALSLIVAPAAAIALVRSNDRTGFAQRVAPPGTNIVALAVVVHFAAMLLFTALGIVYGMALGGLEDRRPESGLGSPNAVYTVIVILSASVIALPFMALPALRRPAIAAGCVIVVAFGWALPWLAQAG